MATKRQIAPGVIEVYGTDYTGRQVRKRFSRKRYGPDFAVYADQEYQKLFDSTGAKYDLAPAAAHRLKSLRISHIADRYKNEYLLTGRSKASNCAAYVDTLCLKWGEHLFGTFTKTAFADWIHAAFDNPIPRMHRGKPEMFQYSAKTLRHFVEYASHMFEWAAHRDIVPANPLKGILAKQDPNGLHAEFKRRIRGRKTVLTDAEFQNLADSMPDYLRRAVAFARHTGMRRAEICNLRWDQIENEIAFLEAGEDKEGDFKRVVLDETAMQVLNEIEIENLANGTTPATVFLSSTGTPLSPNGLTHGYERYRKHLYNSTGNERYLKSTFHRLRNAYISERLNSGVNIEVLGEQVGHHAVEMTRKYYVVDDETRKRILRSTAKNCEKL